MHRSKLFVALVASALLAWAGGPAPTAGARSSERPLVCGSQAEPTPTTDLRRMCASVSNAVKVLRGRASAGREIAFTSNVRGVRRPDGRIVPIGSSSIRSVARLGDGYDEVVAVDPGGRNLVLLFPALSIFDNTPASEDYRAELPIGLLVAPDLVAEPRTDVGVSRARGGPLLSTSGLTQIESACLTIDDDGDQIDETGNAWYRSCWRSYKPSVGDTNPNNKWRVVFTTGSAHGGGISDHLMKAHSSIDGNPDHVIDDWAPTATKHPSPAQSLNVTLSAAPNGVGVMASHNFVSYPDSHGPVGFGSTDDYFRFGWNGEKACGGSVCDYFGTSGGAQFKMPKSSSLGFVFGVHIVWGF